METETTPSPPQTPTPPHTLSFTRLILLSLLGLSISAALIGGALYVRDKSIKDNQFVPTPTPLMSPTETPIDTIAPTATPTLTPTPSATPTTTPTVTLTTATSGTP